MMNEALVPKDTGTCVSLEVVPNSKSCGLSWDPWRKRIKIKVRAKAQKGKANGEILNFFNAIAPSAIVSGQLNREKTVFVEMEKETLMPILESLIV